MVVPYEPVAHGLPALLQTSCRMNSMLSHEASLVDPTMRTSGSLLASSKSEAQGKTKKNE